MIAQVRVHLLQRHTDLESTSIEQFTTVEVPRDVGLRVADDLAHEAGAVSFHRVLRLGFDDKLGRL